MLMANGSDKDAEGNVPDFWATVLQRADAGACVCVCVCLRKKKNWGTVLQRADAGVGVSHTHTVNAQCSL
jgi:hypothetical protein